MIFPTTKWLGGFITLLVCSRATEQYASDWDYDRKLLVTSVPTSDTLKLKREDDIVAIGGGSVIDTAKIISKGPVIAIPTTFSGASRTSHAVYWSNGRKLDLDTEKPITITKPEYLKTLPCGVIRYSRADCICHAVESLISKKPNHLSRFYASTALNLVRRDSLIDLLNASLLAGDAIEITGTNVMHALSYALTAIHKIPHAKALAFLLPRFSFFPLKDIGIDSGVKLNIDIQRVVGEALTYPKVYNCQKPITRNTLVEFLK